MFVSHLTNTIHIKTRLLRKSEGKRQSGMHVLPWQPPHLGHIEHQQANSAGKDYHGHGQSVGGVNEVLFGKDETERSTDANDDHDKVGGNADKAGVVNEEVLDVAALVGQEEAKHDQQSLVDVQGPHKVREILAVALLVTQNGVFVGDLWGEQVGQ